MKQTRPEIADSLKERQGLYAGTSEAQPEEVKEGNAAKGKETTLSAESEVQQSSRIRVQTEAGSHAEAAPVLCTASDRGLQSPGALSEKNGEDEAKLQLESAENF